MPIEVDTYIKAKVIEKIPSIPLKVLLDSISELKPTTWVSSVSLRDSHHMNRAFPLSAQHLSFELQLQRSQSYIHAVIADRILQISQIPHREKTLFSSALAEDVGGDMTRIKINFEAKQAGEAKKNSTELTQNVAMASTISQDSAQTSSGTAANHHPFDGKLDKWTIQENDFESSSALRTIIHDLERMTELCNLKLQRLEATNLEFGERQAIELGAHVQVKTEHPTAPSSAKLSLKRQASPAHDTMDKNSKKARVLPAKRSSVYRMKLSDSDLTDDDEFSI
ncbi:hypothetical protein P875_00022058 [Aspergillus parasiticus SU-1]|uniref:Uncharacterized protein n=2 Tax=Aspergillus parasiticus TaxID=5067 RepID=A0A5N6E1N7_ASPPA|nr:hypothetical protein BDV34DRAFT_220090 [Aspergillus parasiticus]KJK65848.1 hypothetical protein P875_00022058 [Aspergillus parasiticus SU-1]